MNPNDAAARQRSLRQGQAARAKLLPATPLDRAAMADVAVIDGVPARYASTIRTELPDAAAKVATGSLERLVSPESKHDGLIVYSRSPHYAGLLAGAIYSGAMTRNRAAKWYNFPEMADGFTRKIQLDRASEWEIGEMRDWMTDLDSAKFCYDLVVIYDVQAQLNTSYIGTELYKLVHARAIRGLFTVITARAEQVASVWTAAPSLELLISEQFGTHSEAK
jgi:hypothetical protein